MKLNKQSIGISAALMMIFVVGCGSQPDQCFEKEDCGDCELCDNGDCVADPGCTQDCISHHHQYCFENKLYWQDSCSEFEDFITECECGCAEGNSACKSTDACNNHAPVLAPIANQTFYVGQDNQFIIYAIDDDDEDLTIDCTNIPDGANFQQIDHKQARFWWSPLVADAGNNEMQKDYHVNFSVTDGNDTNSTSVIISVVICETCSIQACSQCVGEVASAAASEYCVSANGNLYCATPCDNVSVICEAGHSCIPLADQGTVGEVLHSTQWVCMEDSMYVGKSYVRLAGGNCGTDQPYECLENETCLADTEDTNKYFCSESCMTNDDCVTDCCVDDGEDNYFCVPYWGYCTN
jgi:hypothetical protein